MDEIAANLPNGSVVGRAVKAKWYKFADGVYSIHTAIYDDGAGELVAKFIRANTKTWPSSVAEPGYILLRNATDVEVIAEYGTQFEVIEV